MARREGRISPCKGVRMSWIFALVVAWIGYLAYIGLTNEDGLKNHLLLLWGGLIVLGIALPLLGFR